MADLHVQPKKKTSILPWLLLGLGVLALIFFLTRNREDRDDRKEASNTTTYNSTSENAANRSNDWNSINWSAPSASYDEIRGDGINVREQDNYGIYGLGENVLFNSDQASLRPGAEAQLQQVLESINKRFAGGEVRVFGFTDSEGSVDHNQELAQRRTETVKNWLQKHGIDENRISMQPQGEQNPVASNGTEEGRQQNRRVEIVARRAQ